MREDALYYGDNLDVLRQLADNSVDLIYLDPPFNSQRNYNLVFKDKATAAQKQAFKDVWYWDDAAEGAYRQLTSPSFDGPSAVREMIEALYRFFGPDRRDDMAYPAMMAIRLLEMYRVLRPTGSLYLHCDPTASHYLRLLLDAIFGSDRFVNEITWKRTNVHNDAKRWSPVSDTLLFYSKSSGFTWNPAHAPHDPQYVRDKYRHADADGRLYQLDNMTSPNPRPNLTYEWKGYAPPANGWRYSLATMRSLEAEGRIWYPDSKTKRPRLKRYLDEMSGPVLSNVWTDISPLNSQSDERIGYPTQKPVTLLERIIRASSNPGDVVLDPFCGCGTTIEACLRTGRKWIGIDIGHSAVDVIRERLQKRFPDVVYKEFGIPADTQSAQRLADSNPYAFQWWAVAKVRGRTVMKHRSGRGKKGGDRGVDGEIIVRDYGAESTRRGIIAVKAGMNVGPTMVRDLIGTVSNEKADFGILVTMAPPTAGMMRAAREAGTLVSTSHEEVPRIQIVTIDELFADRPPRLPGRNVTQESVSSGAQPVLPGINDIDPAAGVLRRNPRTAPSQSERATVSQPEAASFALVKGPRMPARAAHTRLPAARRSQRRR